MAENLLVIKRGYIYEFEPKTEFIGKAFALAVSSDARGADNIVSIIILSQNPSTECAQIVNSQFAEGILYCNCGKVTCTERSRLIREVAKVSDKKMQKIDMLIANALGINPVEVVAENKVYKELYLELLERVLGDRDGKTHCNED